MYQFQKFQTESELVDFLNNNDISEDNIITINYNKGNITHPIVLIYIQPAKLTNKQEATWIGNELGFCSHCGHQGCASDIWNGCEDKNYCPNCGFEIK